MNSFNYLETRTPDSTSVIIDLHNNNKYHLCFKQAYEKITTNVRISQFSLRMAGMSGVYYRSFINNLIRFIEKPRYLEVGTWLGSTACAAISNNSCKITCIDNWVQFNGSRKNKEIFIKNIEKEKNNQIDFSLIEEDFYKIDYKSIGKHNVYLFDGPHTEEDQFYGIELVQPALDDIYVLIVDDWNWYKVRKGTTDAIKKLNLNILESIEIKTSHNNKHTSIRGAQGQWHNGYFIAVIKK